MDTPGFHTGQKRALNLHMNKIAINSMKGVDIVLYVIDGLKWNAEDQVKVESIPGDTIKILIINKIDKLNDKNILLPFIEELNRQNSFDSIVPISALKNLGVDDLLRLIEENLPEGEHLYPKNQITNISEKFLASEIIREKCINRIGDELPYRISVAIENFNELENITHINSVIYVEKESQKGMLIGQSGSMLKSIGTSSRKELENLLDTKVMLKTWVKVKKGWSDNEALLPSLGYDLDK